MTATVTEKHPLYSDFLLDWGQCRDCYEGSRKIKSRNTVYLPATSGMIADGYPSFGSIGYNDYQAYLKRAYYPNFFKEGVVTALGMMHSEDPTIRMPKKMEGIRSSRGETLPQLLRRINEEQLKIGRIGLMLDMPRDGAEIPYIATYSTERIINWDEGAMSQIIPQTLNLVVLDEREQVREPNGFSWKLKEKYRVLIIGSPTENETEGAYQFATYDNLSIQKFQGTSFITPSYRGRTLNKIPFVFVNSQDLVSEPEAPPLMDLSELCLTIYRGEADYRQNLFMQGQDTLVIQGGQMDEEGQIRTGAGSVIHLPLGGDAKFIGVTSDGLEEQRLSLIQDRMRAGSMGAQSIDSVSRERESGTSLHVRMGARTASLTQLARAGAGGLEEILKMAAEWIGEDPSEVEVLPNEEFGDFPLTGQSMVEMATAKNLGFPISRRSLHDVAREKGLTRMTYEEELAQIATDPTPEVSNGDRSPDNQGGRDDPEE